MISKTKGIASEDVEVTIGSKSKKVTAIGGKDVATILADVMG